MTSWSNLSLLVAGSLLFLMQVVLPRVIRALLI